MVSVLMDIQAKIRYEEPELEVRIDEEQLVLMRARVAIRLCPEELTNIVALAKLQGWEGLE